MTDHVSGSGKGNDGLVVAERIRLQLDSCMELLDSRGVDVQAACAFHVPGRIEVLGKHTDYAGGHSLLAAAERGLTIAAVPRQDREVRVRDALSGESMRCELDAVQDMPQGWATYPATVVSRMVSNFPEVETGVDIAFNSDIPIAAGMSSSSALVVAVFHALAAVNGVQEGGRYGRNITTREELAEYIAALENGLDYRELRGDTGVGTMGGSEDHTAMLCAREGELVRYSFSPVRFETAVPMPEGHVFAIAASGIRAEKTGAARTSYNRASMLMRRAAELWRDSTSGTEPTVGAILDSGPGAADKLREVLSSHPDARYAERSLLDRVEQFIAEDREIIPAASAALEGGDMDAFGTAVDRSQELAETLLGNQTDETIHLARTAREAGAVAASAFGAGFGGSVWAMVPAGDAESFIAAWRSRYVARFPERTFDSQFFTTGAAQPMVRLF